MSTEETQADCLTAKPDNNEEAAGSNVTESLPTSPTAVKTKGITFNVSCKFNQFSLP